MERLAGLDEFIAGEHASVDDFLREVLAPLCEDTHSDIAFVSLVDDETQASWLRFRTRRVVGRGNPGTWMYGSKLFLRIGDEKTLPDRSQRSISGYVASTRQPYLCEDVTTDPFYLTIDGQVGSEVAVPILAGETLLGVLNIESYQSHFYSPEHIDLLCDVAARIAPRLQELLLREGAESLLLPVLQDILARLADPSAEVGVVLNDVLQKVATLTKARSGFMRIVDGNSLVLQAAYIADMQRLDRLPNHDVFLQIGGENLPEEQRSFSGYVAYTERVQRSDDVLTERCYMNLDPTARSALGAPISLKGQLLGVITLLSPHPHWFTSMHEQFLSTIAQPIAAPLQGLLTAERYSKAPQGVRDNLQKVLAQIEAGKVFATPEVLNAIANQIAAALDSELCTLWTTDLTGSTLTWQGTSVLLESAPLEEQPAAETARAWQALADAFALSRPYGSRRETAGLRARAWQAMHIQMLVNYGPNRNPQFSTQGIAGGPFLLAPLFTRSSRPIGVIHVGLKKRTITNPSGIYSAADEQLLEQIQGILVNAMERHELLDVAAYAAQELHDALGLLPGNILGSLDRIRSSVQLQQSLALPEQQEIEELLRHTEHQVDSLSKEIRAIMTHLKTRDLENQGLADALESYIIEHVERPGLTVQFRRKRVGLLSLPLAWPLYRIAQEAFTNIVKHANASEAQYELDIGPTHVTLSISDNGCGFDTTRVQHTTRYGLGSMRNRAEQLGGRLTLQSVPGQGTVVTVVVERPGALEAGSNV